MDRLAALAAIDNTIARKRVLYFVLENTPVPHAIYDWSRTDYGIDEQVLRVTFLFSLPVTRKVKRQSTAIGGDLELHVIVWALPIVDHRGLAVVSHQVSKRDETEYHEVHVLAPLTNEMDAVLW